MEEECLKIVLIQLSETVENLTSNTAGSRQRTTFIEFIAFLYNIGKEVTRVLLRQLVESIVLTERASRLG